MARTKIKRYMLQVNCCESRISLFKGRNDHVADLLFTDDPMLGTRSKSAVPELIYPLSQYAAAVDMLRHEDPVFYVDKMGIETQESDRRMEKVGDGER